MFKAQDKVAVLGKGRAHIIDSIEAVTYAIFVCDVAQALESQKKPLLRAFSILEQAHPDANLCKACESVSEK